MMVDLIAIASGFNCSFVSDNKDLDIEAWHILPESISAVTLQAYRGNPMVVVRCGGLNLVFQGETEKVRGLSEALVRLSEGASAEIERGRQEGLKKVMSFFVKNIESVKERKEEKAQ